MQRIIRSCNVRADSAFQLPLSLRRLSCMPSSHHGCNTVLAGSPRTITDRLQRMLNAAARVVSNTGKFGRGLTHLLHSELHWLDVPQRILHKLGVAVHRAPQYLMNCCHPTSDVVSDFDLPAATISSYTISSQHARPSGVLHRRSDGLERAA